MSNRQPNSQSAERPTVRHPILAIADVMRQMGAVTESHLRDYLVPLLGLEKYQECIEKLTELGRIVRAGSRLVWHEG